MIVSVCDEKVIWSENTYACSSAKSKWNILGPNDKIPSLWIKNLLKAIHCQNSLNMLYHIFAKV